jgi:ketosteroid isomerase-like protein
MFAAMTHPNATAIQDFYAAFARRDAEGMIARYAPDVRFSDAVFTKLQGEEVFAMWRMLTERAKDLRVEASEVDADDGKGRAHWEAWYTFSATGLPVHNRIDARFVFKDGKIVEHIDTFDLRAWAGMALGMKGKLLGWLPPVQASIRKQADAGLRTYMKKSAG